MVYFPNWLKKNKQQNQNAVADEIEYNTIGEFQNRDSATPGYYIFR